ncbi:MAG: hypothetical protein WD830_08680 [Chloroflexota bacterium]
MGAASLLPYRLGRKQALALVAVVAIVLACLALLAFAVFIGAATVDSSPADPRYLAPFRWGYGARA